MDSFDVSSFARTLEATALWTNILSFISLGLIIAGIVGYCFVIGKTGEKPWKGIIPFYRMYIQCKQTCKNSFFIMWLVGSILLFFAVVGLWFFIISMGLDAFSTKDIETALSQYMPTICVFLVIISIVAVYRFVIECIIFYYLCKSFGFGGGLTAVYVITSLPCCCMLLQTIFVPIFMMVVGFGSAKYIGNAYDNRDNPNFGLEN